MQLNELWQGGMGRNCGQRRRQRRHVRTRTHLSLEGLEERMLLSNYTAANVTELIGDIAAANKAGGENTITLTANTTFTLSQVNNTFNGPTGLPVITSGDNLTIVGNGDAITRSSSSAAFRLLYVASGASLMLENLTLSGGLVSETFGGAGGGVFNSGSLTLQGVTVKDNMVMAGGNGPGAGGGIYNSGSLTIQGTTVEDNTVQGANGGPLGSGGTNALGGGIYSSIGSLSLLGGTLIENNKALGGNGVNATGAKTGGSGGKGQGGGIYVGSGNVILTNATISGNTAQGGDGGHGGSGSFSHPGGKGGIGGLGQGGGLYIQSGAVSLTADTITNNIAHGGAGGTAGFSGAIGQTGGNGGDGAGGGLYVNNGSATLSLDLLAGNTAEGGEGGTGGGGIHKTKAGGGPTSANTGGNGGSGGNGSGGGLFVNSGSVTLIEDALTNNATQGGNGGNGGAGQGAIGNGGAGGNAGEGAGGGLDIVGGNAILTDDTLASNSVQGGTGGKGGGGATSGSPGRSAFSGFGGGIELDNASNATVTNTTLVGNTAQQNGGGIDDASTGTVALLDDTLTANSTSNAFGGGLYFAGPTGLTLQNTLVAGNSAALGGADIEFGSTGITGVDQGGNLIGVSGAGSGNSGFTAATTQTGTVAAPLNPLLGPLQYNGGPLVGASGQQVGLQTEALLPGSPAIGKGVTNNVTTDERGFNRTSPPDIGAFQFQDAALTVAVTPATPTVTVNGSDTFTITVTNTSGNALPADNSTLTVTPSSGLTTTGPLTFPLAALAAGQSQTFTITVTATMSGTQTLTASLRSPDANPNTASGSATVTVLANTPPISPPPITPTPVGALTLFGFGFGPTGLDLFEVDGRGDVFAQAFGFGGMSGPPQLIATDAVFRNLALMNGAIVADLVGGGGQSFLLEVLNFSDPFVFHGLLNALFAGR